MPKDERRKLEPRSRKCIFLGYKPDGNFCYRLLDLENRQVVRSSDIVFNESEMHKSAERPIEVRRVTFSDVSNPLDGRIGHTRAATRQVATTGESTPTASTSVQALFLSQDY